MRHIFYLCLILSLSSCTSSPNNTLAVPDGLRPCCAFGHNLKTKLFGIPIPFFSINNLLDSKHLGEHLYNDGSQFAITKLLGLSKENNGLVYTEKGGFIDIAHVRDTADYTFYLYQQIQQYLGTGKSIFLSDELRSRQIYLPYQSKMLAPAMHKEISITLAGIMAFHLAQWHEIAQWYGFQSECCIPETASAFSPEDLYSNMLGAKIAMQILKTHSPKNVDDFSQYFTLALKTHLQTLGIVPRSIVEKKIMALNGIWWDNKKRLPQKWLVIKRDYRLSLTTYPNGVKNGKPQQFSPILSNGQHYKNWANFILIPSKNETHFQKLPPALSTKKFFRVADFPALAKFAYDEDEKTLGHSPQVE